MYRATHGNGSPKQQVQHIFSYRCCVSETLWGYGYFQTVSEPQEVLSHATIQRRNLESFRAGRLKLPRVSLHFLDGHKGRLSNSSERALSGRWRRKGLVSAQWPAMYSLVILFCKPIVPSCETQEQGNRLDLTGRSILKVTAYNNNNNNRLLCCIFMKEYLSHNKPLILHSCIFKKVKRLLLFTVCGNQDYRVKSRSSIRLF